MSLCLFHPFCARPRNPFLPLLFIFYTVLIGMCVSLRTNSIGALLDEHMGSVQVPPPKKQTCGSLSILILVLSPDEMIKIIS